VIHSEEYNLSIPLKKLNLQKKSLLV